MKTAQGDRAFVQVLQAIRDHGLDPVSVACTLVLDQGTISAPIILNHVSRLVSPVRSVLQVGHFKASGLFRAATDGPLN